MSPEPRRHPLAVLAIPPLVGLALMAVVVFGFASDAVLDSGAATSVALLVAAALILVPPVVYAIAPDAYIQHHRHLRAAIAELEEAIRPDHRTRGPSSAEQQLLDPHR